LKNRPRSNPALPDSAPEAQELPRGKVWMGFGSVLLLLLWREGRTCVWWEVVFHFWLDSRRSSLPSAPLILWSTTRVQLPPVLTVTTLPSKAMSVLVWVSYRKHSLRIQRTQRPAAFV
jgi:hypothetical protein